MRVGIVARKGSPRAAALAGDIRAALDDSEVWVDAATAAALDVDGHAVDAMAACDLVVSVGGDGTFLFAARGAGTTPVMGVNLGEVGFLNATPPERAVEVVRAEVARLRQQGSPWTREMPRLRASGAGWTLPPALNEVAVMGRRGHGRGLAVEVRVDGELYSSGPADGVLVATPAGSTAYNLSEGGPLVAPGVPATVVTGMCAAEPMPPLVVGADSEVTVRIEAGAAAVVGDGRTTERLDPPAAARVRAAEEPLRVAGPPLDFYAALEKLD
jgi:NAD+ kinase